MLQAELSQIGIELSIETQDVLDDPLASGDFDLAILNYAMALIGTPSYFINMLFTTEPAPITIMVDIPTKSGDALAAEIGTTSDNDSGFLLPENWSSRYWMICHLHLWQISS